MTVESINYESAILKALEIAHDNHPDSHPRIARDLAVELGLATGAIRNSDELDEDLEEQARIMREAVDLTSEAPPVVRDFCPGASPEMAELELLVGVMGVLERDMAERLIELAETGSRLNNSGKMHAASQKMHQSLGLLEGLNRIREAIAWASEHVARHEEEKYS